MNLKVAIGIGVGFILFIFGLINFGFFLDAFKIFWIALKPFFVGLIFAYFINLPMSWIEKNLFKSKTMKNKRLFSLLISIVLVLFVFATVLLIIVPLLAESVLELIKAFPSYITSLQKAIEPYSDQVPQLESILDSTQDLLPTATKWLRDYISSNISNYLNTTAAYLAIILEKISKFFLSFAFAIMILLNKEALIANTKNTMQAYLPENVYNYLHKASQLGNKILRQFLFGNVTQAIVLGVLVFIALSLLGFKYVPLYAVLIAICSLVPIIGKSFATTASLLLILISQGPMKAVIYFVTLFVIGQLMGTFINPKLRKDKTYLPPLWTLITVTLGAQFLDFWGIFFCIPLAGLTYTLISQSVAKRLKEKNIEVTDVIETVE